MFSVCYPTETFFFPSVIFSPSSHQTETVLEPLPRHLSRITAFTRKKYMFRPTFPSNFPSGFRLLALVGPYWKARAPYWKAREGCKILIIYSVFICFSVWFPAVRPGGCPSTLPGKKRRTKKWCPAGFRLFALVSGCSTRLKTNFFVVFFWCFFSVSPW